MCVCVRMCSVHDVVTHTHTYIQCICSYLVFHLWVFCSKPHIVLVQITHSMELGPQEVILPLNPTDSEVARALKLWDMPVEAYPHMRGSPPWGLPTSYSVNQLGCDSIFVDLVKQTFAVKDGDGFQLSCWHPDGYCSDENDMDGPWLCIDHKTARLAWMDAKQNQIAAAAGENAWLPSMNLHSDPSIELCPGISCSKTGWENLQRKWAGQPAKTMGAVDTKIQQRKAAAEAVAAERAADQKHAAATAAAISSSSCSNSSTNNVQLALMDMDAQMWDSYRHMYSAPEDWEYVLPNTSRDVHFEESAANTSRDVHSSEEAPFQMVVPVTETNVADPGGPFIPEYDVSCHEQQQDQQQQPEQDGHEQLMFPCKGAEEDSESVSSHSTWYLV